MITKCRRVRVVPTLRTHTLSSKTGIFCLLGACLRVQTSEDSYKSVQSYYV